MEPHKDPAGPQQNAQGEDTPELGAHPREWCDHRGADAGREFEEHACAHEHPPGDGDDHEDDLRVRRRASGSMARYPTQSHQR